MFIGKTFNSLDVKNRLIVPTKLRDKLGSSCVMTKGFEECIYVYTKESWAEWEEKLARLPKADPDARAFVRYFYYNAAECDIDKQGRVTLPQELRDYAHILRDAVTIAMDDRLEIWGREHWEELSGKPERMDAKGAQEAMLKYGI